MSDALANTLVVLQVLLLVRVWVAKRLLDQALDLTRTMTHFDIKHMPEALTPQDIERRYQALPSFGAVVFDLTAWSFHGTFPSLLAEARKRYAMLEKDDDD